MTIRNQSFSTVFRKVLLLLEALWMLVKADFAKADYDVLRRKMNSAVTPGIGTDGENAIPSILGAINRACRYYPRETACLQRSVALSWMLRRRGIPADLEIGVRQTPFESHAWVEVEGKVINDGQRVREVYEPLHEFKAVSMR
jgi:transglutaminase superfamily protein